VGIREDEHTRPPAEGGKTAAVGARVFAGGPGVRRTASSRSVVAPRDGRVDESEATLRAANDDITTVYVEIEKDDTASVGGDEPGPDREPGASPAGGE
jgi:hypothetical protein